MSPLIGLKLAIWCDHQTLLAATLVVLADDDEAAMAMKRLSGSELARAVMKQQEAQRRAALAVQLAWKKRKVGRCGGAVCMYVHAHTIVLCSLRQNLQDMFEYGWLTQICRS